MSRLQILIADDHAVVRRSIRALLESHDRWSVCAEAADGRAAVAEARRLHPDVILLDVSMPQLDGLQAAREIVQEDPGALVLLLTMYPSEEMAAEAARAGARGVIAKSEAHATLIPAIRAIALPPVALASGQLGEALHLAAFFRSPSERYEVLGPFIADGLRRAEKAVHIIDPPDREAYIDALRPLGVDLDRAEAEGQAVLVPWQEAYLRNGRFDQYAMLDLIEQLLSDPSTRAFSRTRLVAHMEWALSDRPGVHDLVEYESRLGYVLPKHDDIVVCTYDLSRFDAHVIEDLIRVHPAIMMEDELHPRNARFVPPDEFLPALRRHGA